MITTHLFQVFADGRLLVEFLGVPNREIWDWFEGVRDLGTLPPEKYSLRARVISYEMPDPSEIQYYLPRE